MDETAPSSPEFTSLEDELGDIDFYPDITGKHGERMVNTVDRLGHEHQERIHIVNNFWMFFEKYEELKAGGHHPDDTIFGKTHVEILEDPENNLRAIFERFESKYTHLYSEIHRIIEKKYQRTKAIENVRKAFGGGSDEYNRLIASQAKQIKEIGDIEDHRMSKAFDGLAKCAQEIDSQYNLSRLWVLIGSPEESSAF